jgi:hypothetical protein
VLNLSGTIAIINGDYLEQAAVKAAIPIADFRRFYPISTTFALRDRES